MEAQENYFYKYNDFLYCKSYIFYLYRKLKKIDFFTNVIVTMISSSCVAGLFLWDDLSILWSIIVVVSQLIIICKQFSSLNTKIERCKYCFMEFEGLCTKVGFNLCEVLNGNLTIKEIKDLTEKYVKIHLEVLSRFDLETDLDNNKRIREIASIEACNYLKSLNI